MAGLASNSSLNLAANNSQQLFPITTSKTLGQQLINIQSAVANANGYLKDNLIQQSVNNIFNNKTNDCNNSIISNLTNSTINNANLYSQPVQFKKNDISIDNYHHQNNLRLNKLRSCNGTQLNGTNAISNSLQITNLASNLVSNLTSNQQQQTTSHQTQLLIGLNTALPSNQLTPAPSPQDQCILNGSNSSSSNSNASAFSTNAVNLLNNSSTNHHNLTNNNVISAIAAIAAAASQSNTISNTQITNSNQQQLIQDTLNSIANNSPSLTKLDNSNDSKTGKSK